MKMDIEKAQKEFIKYTEKYDLSDVNIKRKQEHSIRVMKISKRIAEGMKLAQEEIDIATLIGLLHDIARFEQYTKYHTFKDAESIDHGDLGAEILKKDIKKYIETDEYDELIQLAVKNHNKYKDDCHFIRYFSILGTDFTSRSSGQRCPLSGKHDWSFGHADLRNADCRNHAPGNSGFSPYWTCHDSAAHRCTAFDNFTS